MKSTKMMLVTALSVVFSLGFCSSICAEINFEVLNKSAGKITISMKIGDSSQQDVFSIAGGGTTRKIIPENQTLFLKIREEDNKGIVRDMFKKILPTSKTKYLTFNPSKSPFLYPQTGPYMGLLRKTESGLSLSNNIGSDYIMDGSPANFR